MMLITSTHLLPAGPISALMCNPNPSPNSSSRPCLIFLPRPCSPSGIYSQPAAAVVQQSELHMPSPNFSSHGPPASGKRNLSPSSTAARIPSAPPSTASLPCHAPWVFPPFLFICLLFSSVNEEAVARSQSFCACPARGCSMAAWWCGDAGGTWRSRGERCCLATVTQKLAVCKRSGLFCACVRSGTELCCGLFGAVAAMDAWGCFCLVPARM